MNNVPSGEAKETFSDKDKNHGGYSAELLLVLDALRKAKEGEDERFENRVKEAVEEIKQKHSYKFGVWFAAAGAVVAILGYFVSSGISCVIHDKVNSEFDQYTSREIDSRISQLSQTLKGNIAECTNMIEILKFQLHLQHLRTLAVGGDTKAYDELKGFAKDHASARDCLSSINAYFGSFMRRRGHHSTINELHWGYQKEDLSAAEKLQRINDDPGLSKKNLNRLIGLVAEAKDAKPYTGLLVRKAGVCSDLFDRSSLIDCIHVSFANSPRSPDLELLRKWWNENKREEYDRAEAVVHE